MAPFAILLVVAGCGGTPNASSTSSNAAASAPTGSQASGAAADPGTASTILKAARLNDADSRSALEGVRLTPAGTDAAAGLLRDGVTGDALWAATYVYASGGSDPAPLRPIATNTSASPTVRAMAAAGLVGMGDVAGFEPLIAALGGSDAMDGAEPAGAVWEFAADVLERYTRTGFGPTLTAREAERAARQTDWKAWLEANRTRLHFDAATGLWVST